MCQYWTSAQSRILSRKMTKSENGNLYRKFIPWWKLVNFDIVVKGHNGHNISKFGCWEIHVTHLNIFWIFQLWGQISRKSVREAISRFVALSTKLTTENRNMKWKPEPEVVFGAILAKNHFLGFSRANISVALGLRGPYLGPYLTFGD